MAAFLSILKTKQNNQTNNQIKIGISNGSRKKNKKQ